MLPIYTTAVFASAFLLFLVQPMFASLVLPLLGGSPGVWNTALVFYQSVLLGGYLYAHFSTRWLRLRHQVLLHLVLLLLGILFLPFGIPSGWAPPPVSHPTPWLLALLASAIGLPLLVVSAGSPLLQSWFSRAGHPQSPDPYFLYAASNMGSMLALIAYPLAMEPFFRLGGQALWWTAGYYFLAAVTGLCAIYVWRSGDPRVLVLSAPSCVDDSRPAVAVDREHPWSGWAGGGSDVHAGTVSGNGLTLRRRLRWLLLAFVPSSLLLSVTSYIATDIASVPLLWVIPLGIYLSTYILAFSRRPPIPLSLVAKAVPLALLPLVVALTTHGTDPIVAVILLHLTVFFLIALLCHSQLAADRPAALQLTEFYLWLSAGGVLGGAFNALAAPLLFNGIAEYPLVLALSCTLLPAGRSLVRNRRTRTLDIAIPLLLGLAVAWAALNVPAIIMGSGALSDFLAFGLPAIACFAFSRRPLRFALAVAAVFLAAGSHANREGRVLHAERSFFGVARVTADWADARHDLMHGSTLHGRQLLISPFRREPTLYYHRTGPIGQYFAAYGNGERLGRIAVVGLGAGAIAAYARTGQQWTFFEIDPVIERIARDTRYFTYLKDCPADVHIVLGDGRLSLTAVPDKSYDLLILDAYSSDSMPVHLLTREAMQLYLDKATANAVLVFHISNRYLDLQPVLGNLARELGLVALVQTDSDISPNEAEQGKTPATFVVMARDRTDLGPLIGDPRWRPCRIRPELGVWTDDFSSIFAVFRWHRQAVR